MEERRRKLHLGRWIVLFVLVAAAVWVGLNRQWLYDYYRGATYQPSAEMARIRSDLRLTERGEFLFNAAQPELNESGEFNAHCRSVMDTEVAVLGCYNWGNIYVYNVTDAELDGIRELTAAHELLHAVYARMSNEEKANLKSALDTVYSENAAVLEDDLKTYDATQRSEELYVRAGTEVANLPEVLERHYAEVFRDQDAVVAFYNQYIAVFREVEAEMTTLKAEMDTLASEIDSKTATYEAQVSQLNADIVSFNSCAEVAGCFENQKAFDERRATLVAIQKELGATYEEIGQLVEKYNAKVVQYNQDVNRGEELNQKINSISKPQSVK